MSERVYLDWNATAPLLNEARAAMIAAMENVGNPSSVHAEGRAAKAIVEHARAQVAALVGAEPQNVIFTSGATEAAALAAPASGTMLASAAEHDAIMSWTRVGTGRAADLAHLLKLDADGVVSGGIADEPALGGRKGCRMAAVQAANSETGVLQDTVGLARKLRSLEQDVLVLVDAAQAAGKVPCSMEGSGADFIIVSAHKLGGPKGVGALIVRQGIEVQARIRGGGQEMGRRSGTENVAGIAGFGAAAEAAARALAGGEWNSVERKRDILEDAIAAAAPQTIFMGQGAARLPNTSCFATPGWKGETQVMSMDLAGFAISAGSACSSGKVGESRVLRAMGHDSITARSAIRISIGPSTTEDEIERFIDAWAAAERKFRIRAA